MKVSNDDVILHLHSRFNPQDRLCTDRAFELVDNGMIHIPVTDCRRCSLAVMCAINYTQCFIISLLFYDLP